MHYYSLHRFLSRSNQQMEYLKIAAFLNDSKAYTETSIGQCHYRFHKGEGTPIVFLHQTPSSSLMYEEIIQLMPQNTCIAIDTPGFGMSDDISGNPNVADYGQSIIEALINIKMVIFTY